MQSTQIPQNPSQTVSQNQAPMPSMSTTNRSDRNRRFSSMIPHEDEVGLILHRRSLTPPGISDGVQVVVDKFQATKKAIKSRVISSWKSKIGTPFKEKTKRKLLQYNQDMMEGEARKENGWTMKAWRVAGRVTGAQDEIDDERWEAERAKPFARAAAAAVVAAAAASTTNTRTDGPQKQHAAVHSIQGSVDRSSLPGCQLPAPPTELGPCAQSVNSTQYTDGYNQRHYPVLPRDDGQTRTRGYGDLPVGLNEDITTLSGEIHDRLKRAVASTAPPASSTAHVATTSGVAARTQNQRERLRLRPSRLRYSYTPSTMN